MTNLTLFSQIISKLDRISFSKLVGEKKQIIEPITNQLKWSCNTIAELYKSRWEVEIFFRGIKQLLHIKSFIGTSKIVVMIQI